MNGRRMLLPMRSASLLLLLWFLASPASAAEGKPGPARLSAEEALRLGEAMYLKGVLPSGKPMKAVVQGDIEVTGAMITCASCHMRSGLGSVEGNVLTPPTNGARLFAPLRSARQLPGGNMARALFKHKRPAYTEASLAKALRSGVDPAGRALARTMPRYNLDDGEMEILVSYLKNLSSGHSPGVTGNAIRFATVVAEGVSAKERDAMLRPLMAYVQKEWNANIAVLELARREKGFRKASLDVWELKGPPGTWNDQLEALYRRKPVFALLGGIAPGTWGPVHEFCEKNRVPCVFPITDLPAVSGSDWYTLYFSKGYYQEGEAAGKFLARVFDLPPDKEVVQVFRSGGAGNALSRGVEDAWKTLGKSPLRSRNLAPGEKTGRDFWKELSAAHRGKVMLVWLGPEDLSGIEVLGELSARPSTVLVSSTMLAEKLSSIPDGIRDFTFLTYPRRLPDEQEYVSSIVKQWLKGKNLPVQDLAVSSKVYFLTRSVAKVLTDMRGNFYRDYFLDLFDLLEDQTASAVAAPRLTFGPGQRYASKGCYVVALTKGAKPTVLRRSDWIVY